MADPLSVAAGVTGIVTAAASITKFLIRLTGNIQDAPKHALAVLSEVNDTSTILSQLQPFLLGLETPDQSRACRLQVEKVITILTGCVATFSELQEVLDGLETEEIQAWDRLKWSRKEGVIAALLARLQTHKASLSLVLIILNGNTIHEVKTSMDDLQASVQQSYQEILARVRGLESRRASSISRVTTTGETNTPKTSDLSEAGGIDRGSFSRSSRVFNFRFEKDLAFTRAYRRIKLGRSVTSVSSTNQPGSRWSALSDLSVADVLSQISVYDLGIMHSELYKAQQYAVGSVGERPSSLISLPRQSSPLTPPISELSAIFANLLRPSDTEIWDLEKMVSHCSQYLMDCKDEVLSIPTATVVRDVLGMFGVPQENVNLLVPWEHSLYILYGYSLPHHSYLSYCFKPDDAPLGIYERFRKLGRRPLLVFRSRGSQEFDNGYANISLEKLGMLVDGWYLDERLFYQIGKLEWTTEPWAQRIAFFKTILDPDSTFQLEEEQEWRDWQGAPSNPDTPLGLSISTLPSPELS